MFFWEVHELWRSVFESVAIFFDLWDSLISIWRHLRTFNLCMVGFSKLMDGIQKYIWKDDHSVTSRNSFLNDRAPKFWSTLRLRGPSGLPIYHHLPIWFSIPLGEVHVPHIFKIYAELPLQLVAMLRLWSCSFCRTSSGGSHDAGLETKYLTLMYIM